MRRILSALLVLLVAITCVPNAFAANLSPREYVISKGFQIALEESYSDSVYCTLSTTYDYAILSFVDNDTLYTVFKSRNLNGELDVSDFYTLFCNLVENYAWPLTYYWPDSENNEQIAISYGIHETMQHVSNNNLPDQESFLVALKQNPLYTGAAYDPFKALGVDRNSIYVFGETELGLTPAFAAESTTPLDAYVNFLIDPTAVICSPGGSAAVEVAYFPPSDEWTPSECWEIYGKLIDYVVRNSADLIADGLACSSADANCATIAIAIGYDDIFHSVAYDPDSGILTGSLN